MEGIECLSEAKIQEIDNLYKPTIDCMYFEYHNHDIHFEVYKWDVRLLEIAYNFDALQIDIWT